jgi:hypothetical protein
MRHFTGLLSVLIFSGIAAQGSTLSVTSSVSAAASFYDYSYDFTVSGAGKGFDNIFLGSNDLSPLNVVIHLNGAPTADWSYLGNDTPENYLQFFSLSSTALAAGGTLEVTFDSIFAPSSTEFAVALNSATSQTSNQVNNVTAPGAVPTPEPATLSLLLVASVLIAAVVPVRAH